MAAVTVLDGGMSRELMRVGAPFRQPEWSALALIESPEHVRRAHEEFARAGADVLTTNAYAVVPFHLGEERFARDGAALARHAAELARSVADEFEARVAGCLPPALGSYRPDLFDPEPARRVLETLVEAQAPFVDVWLVETVSSVAEAELALSVIGARGDGRPVWLAFTVDDADGTRLRSGEPVVAAIETAVAGGADVLAFNCSQPEALADALRVAVAAGSDVPLGVYANVLDDHSGDGANEIVHEVRADASADAYIRWVDEWVALGATVVGGCCGTDARHIAALSAHLSAG